MCADMALPRPPAVAVARSEARAPTPRSDHGRRRRPCDRCHKIKERCRWPTDDGDVCIRCARLNFHCQSNRPLAKKGRKSRLATGNQLALRRTEGDQAKLDEREHSHHSDSSSSHDEALTPFAHSYETSSWTSGEVMIPSPRRYGDGVQHGLEDIHRGISPFPEMSGLESQLLELMIHKQIDVDKYLIGPSFREQHQQAFINHLRLGMPLVKDAFIACTSLMAGNQKIRQLATAQHVGHKRAATAIAALRHLEIHRSDSHDLSTVLILGAAIVTFAMHHSGGEASLCPHILGLIQPFHDRDPLFIQRLGSDGVAFLICLLGTETVVCLLQCRVPTIRVRHGDFDRLVDRFIGIAAPLLTRFYDICELAQRIHHSRRRRGSRVLQDEALQVTLDTVNRDVEQWLPTIPINASEDRFTMIEVNLMLAQAKVLRLAALLMTHRLYWAYGVSDHKAIAMSRDIRDELDIILRLTGHSLPFVDLAYLVACFEITDPGERLTALSKLPMIVDFSPRSCEEMETWLVSFWTARDDGSRFSIYWDDIGSRILA